MAGMREGDLDDWYSYYAVTISDGIICPLYVRFKNGTFDWMRIVNKKTIHIAYIAHIQVYPSKEQEALFTVEV